MIGQSLSHYEITAKLGAGGMGEVYRATDTKLGREVAIKVLPEEFIRDPERLARFEREARVLASLNHPAIGQIYGLEEAGGVRALVLELVEGPTLAERIDQGPLPLDEAMPIAEQVAEGLAAAHAAAVIHRDLKPANVKVRPDGAVKVLDFGLAKALEPEPEAAQILRSRAPTLTSPATRLGTILGTAPYMAPEQVEGKPVDARADIFAFGSVLYEMLTAERAFPGTSAADVLSRILRAEPVPLRERLPGVPDRLVWLVDKCLAKSPKERYQGAADLAVDLRRIRAKPRESAGQVQPAAGRLLGSRAAVLVAATLFAALLGILFGRTMAPEETSSPRRFEIVTVDPQPLAPGGGRMVSITDDGTRIAFLDQSRLQIRDLTTGVTRPLPSTTLAITPFFSPDGDWVGFTHSISSVAKKVWADGGEPFEICSAAGSGLFGADWGPNDTIVLSDGRSLYTVPAGATGCRPFGEATRDPSHSYRDPQFLPDEESILVELFVHGDGGSVHRSVARLSGTTGELLEIILPDAGSPRYLANGYLAFLRGSTIFAVAFDAASGTVSGEPVPVLEEVDFGVIAQMDVSAEGTAIYVPSQAEPELELVWVDREGREEPLAVEPAPYWTPRISPAGDLLALGIRRPGGTDLYLVDPVRGTREPFAEQALWPAWTADGERLAFASRRDSRRGLWWKPVEGGGPAERLAPVSEDPRYVLSVSSDPPVFTFYEVRTATERDILVMRPGEQPVTLVETPGADQAPRLSADARYLAYATDTSGRREVYVRTCPPCRPDLDLADRRWRLSENRGTAPVWSRDGREIFYLEGRKMMAVPVRTEPSFDFDPPTVLFESDHIQDQFGNPNYDVAADGRFLMIRGGGREAPRHRINVIVDWFREVQERVEGE